MKGTIDAALNMPAFFGLIGVSITLMAYILLSLRRLNPREWLYSALNAFGSLLIIVSLFYQWNLAAFFMEISWLLVSVYGVYQAIRCVS